MLLLSVIKLQNNGKDILQALLCILIKRAALSLSFQLQDRPKPQKEISFYKINTKSRLGTTTGQDPCSRESPKLPILTRFNKREQC